MMNVGNHTFGLITNPLGRTQAIGYDNLNRVAAASGAYGAQSYTYDGVGNRLSRTAGGVTETYAYSPMANRVTTITAGGNTRSFTYAASGQVTRDLRDPATDYTFAVNDNGRVASASLNAAASGAYLYNAFEQRVRKTVGATVTQFVFDRAGHLLAEADGAGATQKEYIWLDDMPVALVDATGGSPMLYFIHTDHLGTPQKLTDAARVTVWDGIFDPFGNPVAIAGGQWDTATWNNFPWGAPPLTLTNLRFPGQYLDAETLLHQNWFRDYDPSTGRYNQSDPIGLLAGPNTFSYVGCNPLAYTDPWGLRSGIIVWGPSGWGQSSLGHVSAYVDNTSFSYNPSGMNIESLNDYLARNAFRPGYGFDLRLSNADEQELAKCLSETQGDYSALSNNCTNPAQRCLRKVGRELGRSRTPFGLMQELLGQPNWAQPGQYFPQSRPA